MNPFPTFDPHSSLAQPIVHLSVIVGIIMGVILLLVIVLVLVASIRFRHKEGHAEPPQHFGNNRIEIAWTLGPILILAFLLAATLRAMNESDPMRASGQQPDLTVIAHQWWWEVRYPNSGVVAANEIHIPVGRRLFMRLESADVIHDWWVPALGRKMDAIPGHPNDLWLEADSPGSYQGTCAEYCGVEHAWMRILVIAESEGDFEKWSVRQLQPASQTPEAENTRAGDQLFQQLTCPSCHSTTTSSTDVEIGPNLAHIASRQTLAAGRLENTPANLIAWLSDPQSVKPDCHMPNFQLTQDQVAQLTAYLETLQ